MCKVKEMEVHFVKRCLLLALVVSLACISVTAADDTGVTVEIDSDYRVTPESGVVHVTKQVAFINTDLNTKYRRGYYSSFNHYLPENAKNIKAYDTERTIAFRKAQEGYHVLQFNRKVWHGETYTFYIEYELDINRNTAAFYILEYGDNTEVTLEVPSGFDTHLARDGYEVEEKQYSSVYTFQRGVDWNRSCLVSTIRHTDYFVLSDVAHLQERDVRIQIRYWEGEEAWAQHMLDTALTSLPILEETWGMPYPAPYDITITQANITETGGYGGYNQGKKGIAILYTSSNEILIHELAHYWTRACNFDQLWMDEGYADLYTYIVLNETNPEKAVERRDRFLQKYENMKNDHDFPLSDWDIPDSIDSSTGEKVDFGYKKAFALAYELYEDIGIENMKSTNLQFAASGTPVNEEMFVDMISTSSGSDLTAIEAYIY
jgi:hypothetical protein